MGRYLTKTNEYVSRSGRKSMVDQSSYTIGYRKMKSLVINIKNEIVSDIEIHDKQVLPTFVDLPFLSTCLYSLQLSNKLRAFLAACRPVSLSPPVTDLIFTTCDFQKDLLDWNISHVNDGFDAKALFNMHITKRINDKRLELLKSCNLCKNVGNRLCCHAIVRSGLAQMATNGNLGKVVTTCGRSQVRASPWGFSLWSKKGVGLSPK
nr:mammalian uncoordinated homology 13, domain 2 [Tanacetum cinerariifolium]